MSKVHFVREGDAPFRSEAVHYFKNAQDFGVRHGFGLDLTGSYSLHACPYLILETSDLLRHFHASDEFRSASVYVETQRIVDVVGYDFDVEL